MIAIIIISTLVAGIYIAYKRGWFARLVPPRLGTVGGMWTRARTGANAMLLASKQWFLGISAILGIIIGLCITVVVIIWAYRLIVPKEKQYVILSHDGTTVSTTMPTAATSTAPAVYTTPPAPPKTVPYPLKTHVELGKEYVFTKEDAYGYTRDDRSPYYWFTPTTDATDTLTFTSSDGTVQWKVQYRRKNNIMWVKLLESNDTGSHKDEYLVTSSRNTLMTVTNKMLIPTYKID